MLQPFGKSGESQPRQPFAVEFSTSACQAFGVPPADLAGAVSACTLHVMANASSAKAAVWAIVILIDISCEKDRTSGSGEPDSGVRMHQTRLCSKAPPP